MARRSHQATSSPELWDEFCTGRAWSSELPTFLRQSPANKASETNQRSMTTAGRPSFSRLCYVVETRYAAKRIGLAEPLWRPRRRRDALARTSSPGRI